jgi:hypothetical protein
LTLRENLYEEARSTDKAHRRALAIVVLAAVSRALGGVVILMLNRAPGWFIALGFCLDVAAVVGGYYFWTFTILKVGQWLKRRPAPTYADLLSPIGFAYAPQVLNVLTLIPLLGRPIELVLAVWSLMAVTIAVREALDISTGRAVLICLIGWPLIQVAIGSIQVVQQLIGRSL